MCAMNNAQDILSASILIVDDLEADVMLLEQILRRAGYSAITSTMKPQNVYALHLQNRYDLILLDLQMPEVNGFAIMKSLREIEIEDYLPVIVITAYPEERLHALKVGANDFICKPIEIAEVLVRVHNMLEVRLLHRKLHNHNSLLAQQVQERTQDLQLRAADLQEGYLETIFTMTRAAELKDEDTGAHVQRISYYSRELAKILGADEKFIDTIFFASPMHDVGKIGIPDCILLKPCGFTPEEWLMMQGHSAMGAKILGDSKSPYLKMGAEIALNHHERWDGSGYPNGKKGEEIPLCARIMNICDIYDALRSKRPYKPAFSHKKALNIITHGDGRTLPTHFDPMILTLFQENNQTFRDIFDQHIERP